MASKRLTPLLLSHAIRHPTRHTLRLLPPISLRSSPSPAQYHLHPPSSRARTLSTTPPSSPAPQSKTYTFKDIHSLSTNPNPSTLLIDVREPSELASTGRIPTAVSMPLVSNPDAVYLSPADFEERFGFPKPGSLSSSPSSSSKSSSSSSADIDEVREQAEEMGRRGDGNPAPYVAGHGGADVGAASVSVDDDVEGQGGGVQEVVFYCKAGVRSRAAMQMARGEGGWEGVGVGQWEGGWVEWEKEGGKVKR